MKPTIFLALIKYCDPRGNSKLRERRKEEEGFSLAVVFLVVLTVIFGSLAIVNRAAGGNLAALFQSSNREARENAEHGIVEIVSELNKEANRKILVSGQSPSVWNQNDTNLVNSCTGFTSANAVVVTSTPTATAIGYKSGAVTSGTRQYQLADITYTLTPAQATTTSPILPRVAFSGTTPSDLISGVTKSQMRITVVGRVLSASGSVLSEARVTREYEVVPKCCKRSFGRNRFGGTTYGDDARVCPGPPGGAALILSLNGGTIGGANNTFTITDENGNIVTQAICREGATGGCTATSTNTIGPTVSVVPKTFLAIEPPPFAASVDRFSPAVTITGADLPTGTVDGTAQPYIRVNSLTQNVETCNSTLTSCTPPDYCGKNLVDGQFYCKVNQISTSNANTVVDTSNGIINFYFDNPDATPTTSYAFTVLGGNGTISQRYCAGGQSGTTPCTTGALVTQADRLNFFAFSTEPGNFEIRGSSGGVVMNIFAPTSDVAIRGSVGFAGRIWADGFTRTGVQSASVNNSLPVWCTTYPLSCPPAAVTTGIIPVDWIARSVSQTSSF